MNVQFYHSSDHSLFELSALKTTLEERGLIPLTLLICISSFALETTPEERGLRHKLAPILPSRWVCKPPRKSGDTDSGVGYLGSRARAFGTTPRERGVGRLKGRKNSTSRGLCTH